MNAPVEAKVKAVAVADVGHGVAVFAKLFDQRPRQFDVILHQQ